ncbi:HNH endonuclease [Rhodococcus fascians]|nr:HNH endonuclease [Rhodococcus fascians]MBY4416267.1 HNH endonuclease [Rhodococcus fascians]
MGDLQTARWQKLRASILIRDDYMCAWPGCEKTATTVDHIRSRHRYPELTWDEENLQSLCAYHNYSKGAKDMDAVRQTWFNSEWFDTEYIQQQLNE